MRTMAAGWIVAGLLLGSGCSDEPFSTSNPSHPATAARNPSADESAPAPSTSGASKAQPISEDALKAAIRDKNPGFAGEIQVGSDGSQIVAVQINDPALEDISPLAGLPLQMVDLSKTHITDIRALGGMPLVEAYLAETGVADLGPLKGAPLQQLNLVRTRVADLSPLKGAPIRMLWLNDTPVSDITPLRTSPLESLTLAGTKVSDLGPLKGHPLQRLHIARTEVTNLSPLRWMNLSRLIFTPARIKTGIEHARSMGTLREIGTAFGEEDWGIPDTMMAPGVFWEMYDAGKLE